MKNTKEWKDVQIKRMPADPEAPKLTESKGGVVMDPDDVDACASRLPEYRPTRKQR